MNHPVRVFIWAICGLLLLLCAALVPAHFRAADIKLIENAGASTPSVVQVGASFLNREKIGPARMLWRAAAMLGVEDHERLGAALARVTRAQPNGSLSPKTDPVFDSFQQLFQSSDSLTIIGRLMERSTREKLIDFLQSSRRPGVQEILKNRMLTNTVQFPPATSPAGQPLDAVIALTGLLSQTDQFASGLREKIEFLALHANGGGTVEPLEAIYLDLLSLGQRLDWVQLAEFIRGIEDTATLHDLAQEARTLEEKLPLLYASVVMADQPRSVARYLAKFTRTGLDDLGLALSNGKGALNELLTRQQRISAPKWRLHLIGYDPFGAFFYAVLPLCRTTPWAAILLRCFLFLCAALCLARALISLSFQPSASSTERGDRIRLVQDCVLALCIFTVALLSFEPFIVSNVPDIPKVRFPIRLQFPMAGSVVASQIPKTIQPLMSLATLTSLLSFFVLQALVYIWCLAKISEIRRQPIGPRMKLKLLENEEHLFDAGLYLGLVGTIVSLIVYSLGIVTPSLMAAYSSTSFGIIFVSILKIFHIRPLRRQLLFQSEPES